MACWSPFIPLFESSPSELEVGSWELITPAPGKDSAGGAGAVAAADTDPRSPTLLLRDDAGRSALTAPAAGASDRPHPADLREFRATSRPQGTSSDATGCAGREAGR